jgi:RND superfamily putative drug exporter
MLERLGRLVVRRRGWVALASVALMVVAGAIGGSVASKLNSGGFDDPQSESGRARTILNDEFHTGSPNLVLVLTARAGSVDAAAVRARGVALTRQLAAEPGMQAAFSYWTLGSPPPLRSKDGSRALLMARITGDDDVVKERAKELGPRYTIADDAVTVAVGGIAQVYHQISDQVETDLKKAEAITFPLVLILLVLVFGGLVAAGLPLAVGLSAVIGTFLVLRILVAMTHVSIFSINLTTAMGLGLGIDYSLFIVSRFREEVRAGRTTEDAVVRTVQTSGRTVVFSAATVAASLAALLVFPVYFLRSFAYAGIAVVTLAAISAIVFLPALLAMLGPRVDKLTLWKRAYKPETEGMWHRIATFVMRRPWPVTLAVLSVLVVLGLPFFGIKIGLPDDRVLPKTATSRQVQDVIRSEFSSQEAGALAVVARANATDAVVADYAGRLSAQADVARVDARTGSYIAGQRVVGPNAASQRFASPSGTWLSVVPSVEPMSARGESLAKNVRALSAPFDVLVSGPSADLVDSKHGIFSRAPLAGLIIALVTFITLFLFTGSVLIPVKALVLNLLSLSATFGAMVWVFQQGHLSGLLGFTATGTIDGSTPILMFCVAFGLSMDYEIFLLSRIKEDHDVTGDNVGSVARGLERTGRIVTAAAALLAVVFVAFSTSKVSFIKLFGIGLALAVVMDATLIRGVLVPAFMRLAGNANWWAPKPLKRLYERIGLHEAEPAEAAAATGAAAGPPGKPNRTIVLPDVEQAKK